MRGLEKRLTDLETQASPQRGAPYIVCYTHDYDTPEEQQRVLDEAHEKAGATGTVIHVQYDAVPLPDA